MGVRKRLRVLWGVLCERGGYMPDPPPPLPGANVFIASNGHLKLGDFGLSFQLRNTSRSVMDEIADNVGTVPYMAPEVIRSGKTHHIGRASDIWSVGCTVIEMITGKVSPCSCPADPVGPRL